MNQPSLFNMYNQTKAGVVFDPKKGIEISKLFPVSETRDLNIIPYKYHIYPTGETHPFSDMANNLKGSDFPFITSKSERGIKILKPMLSIHFDYPMITLQSLNEGNNTACILFHKIVGRAFFKPPKGLTWQECERKYVFHHKDNKTWNYRVSNLEHIPQKQNITGKKKKASRKDVFEQAKIRGLV